MNQDYRIIVQVEQGQGGSPRSSGTNRKTVPSVGGNKVSPLSMMRNPMRASSSFAIGAKTTAAVFFAGMVANKAVTEGMAISARLSGDPRGQISWDNMKSELSAMVNPFSTGIRAISSMATEYKTNEAVSINRELYGVNDYRKGTK